MFIDFVGSDGIDTWIEVESWDLRVVLPYVHRSWIMIRDLSYFSGSVVVEMRKGYLVFCPNRVPHYDLINIVELVPIFIEVTEISV